VNLSYVQRRLGGDFCFSPVNVYINAVPVAFLRGGEVAYFGDPAEIGAATRFKCAGAMAEEAVSGATTEIAIAEACIACLVSGSGGGNVVGNG
jgi:hypothetical protein